MFPGRQQSPGVPTDCAGPELAALFADPGIVKVLHGADSDVLWMQRDFGLFPVNLFDTGQAARVLEYPSFGLAYLLHHFCAFKVLPTPITNPALGAWT